MSRFGRDSKLSLKFIRSFEVIGRVGQSTYRLLLVDHMWDVHDVFHISILTKWVTNINHIIFKNEVVIRLNLAYTKELESILAYDVRL